MGNRIVVKHADSKVLTDDEITVLQKASKLSADKIKELHREFIEVSPTRKMNKVLFKAMWDGMNGGEGENADLVYENAFAVFDANKDGFIDFKELIVAYFSRASNDVDSKLEDFFKICDLSGDGYIDHKELADLILSSVILSGNKDAEPEIAKAAASTIFANFGVGDDGKISKEQFIKG